MALDIAHDHPIAAAWLRADRSTRRAYWTPAAVRRRADGAFPAEDFWNHCDIGGHPTTDGRRLLPDDATINVTYLWADLAGHLARIWADTRVAAEAIHGSVTSPWELPDADRAISDWRNTDRLIAALAALSRQRRNQE